MSVLIPVTFRVVSISLAIVSFNAGLYDFVVVIGIVDILPLIFSVEIFKVSQLNYFFKQASAQIFLLSGNYGNLTFPARKYLVDD